MPVVMESGEGKLEDSMYLLMKHNYELLAKKLLSAEKALCNENPKAHIRLP